MPTTKGKSYNCPPMKPQKAAIYKSIGNHYARIGIPGIGKQNAQRGADKQREAEKKAMRKTGAAGASGTPKNLIVCDRCGSKWQNANQCDGYFEFGRAFYLCRKCRDMRKSGQKPASERFSGVCLTIPHDFRKRLPAAHSANRVAASVDAMHAALAMKWANQDASRELSRMRQEYSEKCGAAGRALPGNPR